MVSATPNSHHLHLLILNWLQEQYNSPTMRSVTDPWYLQIQTFKLHNDSYCWNGGQSILCSPAQSAIIIVFGMCSQYAIPVVTNQKILTLLKTTSSGRKYNGGRSTIIIFILISLFNYNCISYRKRSVHCRLCWCCWLLILWAERTRGVCGFITNYHTCSIFSIALEQENE